MSDKELERRTTEEARVYTNFDDLYLPSVSSVLDEMPTPEAIKQWKKNNDGTDGKHWRDILSYKGDRGTMIHYNLLKEFEDEDMYSKDEEKSEESLKTEGDWTRYLDDLVYAEDVWSQIKQFRGIEEDSVLNVECFVTNTAVGYAGQFDLLYIDDEGDIVLSDIKTSNQKRAPYTKHKLQLTAYMHAIDLSVDKLEVIIIHPDSKKWKISHNTDWNDDIDNLWKEFRELREEMGDVESQMKSIAEEGINDG